MRQESHHLYLGIFVLTAISLLAGAVTLLGARSLWQEYTLFETYIVESVNGLEMGSAVKFRGIPVGRVEDITIVGQDYETELSYALIRAKVLTSALAIPQGETVSAAFDEQVRKGLRVTLATTGITGGKYLEAEFITDHSKYPEPPIDWEPRQLYIPSAPSTLFRMQGSLDKFLGDLGETDIPGLVRASRDTLEQLTRSMKDADVRGLSESLQGSLKSLTRNADSIAADVRVASKAFSDTVADLRGAARGTLESADKSLQTFNRLMERTDLEASLKELSSLIQNAERAVSQIRKITERTDSTIRGVQQLVYARNRDLQLAVGSLRDVLSNLGHLTDTLREYPSLLFVGKAPKPGLRRAQPASNQEAGK